MYRVIVYVNNRPVALYSELRGFDEADRLLERAISSDFATGGHIEQDVPGIGWCVATEPEVELGKGD